MRNLDHRAMLVLSRVIAILLVFCAGDSIAAEHFIERLPKDLIYRGKPIEPSCIPDLMMADESTTALKDCPRPSRIIEGPDAVSDLFGYRYEDPQSGAAIYRGYRYIGDLGGLHVILARADDGGSLHVSNLLLLFRRGDTISTVILEDRFGCGRGVSNASIKDGELRYSCWAWLSDLAEASGLFDAEHPVPRNFVQFSAPYHADYRIDFKDGEVQGVQLPAPRVKSRESCLSKAEQRYRDNYRFYLTYGELKEFIHSVLDECEHGLN